MDFNGSFRNWSALYVNRPVDPTTCTPDDRVLVEFQQEFGYIRFNMCNKDVSWMLQTENFDILIENNSIKLLCI